MIIRISKSKNWKLVKTFIIYSNNLIWSNFGQNVTLKKKYVRHLQAAAWNNNASHCDSESKKWRNGCNFIFRQLWVLFLDNFVFTATVRTFRLMWFLTVVLILNPFVIFQPFWNIKRKRFLSNFGTFWLSFFVNFDQKSFRRVP